MSNRSRRAGLNSSQAYGSQPVASTSRSPPVFASQTVNRPSRGRQSTIINDESEIEGSVNAAVMIALSMVGNGKPFKKADLLQGCKIKNHRTVADTIIKEAQTLLYDIYGLKLVEVTQGKFILVVPKTAAFRNELASKSDSVPSAFSSLLGVVLTLIFVQKGRLAEEYLKTTMLPKLFPDIATNPHPYFGNVDKLFAEFEHQAYITKEVESRGGENIAFYKWGVRAEQEINKKDLVIPVMKAMFGGNLPHSLLAELENKEGPTRIDEEED